MKKDTLNNWLLVFLFLIFLFISLSANWAAAQNPAFTLSPKWYFGNRAGLDFTGGVPTPLTGGQVNGWGQEGSSTICDVSGNIVFYTDSYRLYDAGNNQIQLLNGGTSSTQSSVCIPDPADPLNKYYLFTANVDDNGSGDKPSSASDLGIHYYHIKKSGATVVVIAGPVKIANHDEVSEQICAASDGYGNYWVISHQGGDYSAWTKNEFWAWPISSSGVGALVRSAIPGTTGNNVWQGSIKINKCHTRLAAVFSTGSVEVYDWDQSTGKVTNLLRRISGYPAFYGCEFSPNGNILYFTSHTANLLYQLDITSGIVYSEPGWGSSNNRNEMGTLQLGPDDKLYVTNASDLSKPAYLGVVNNPDIAGAGCNYNNRGLELNNGTLFYPNIHRGISNIAWLSPQSQLTINNTCPSVNGAYAFQNYFNKDIDVVPGSEEWDFGDGHGFRSGLGANPSYSYNSSGIFTIRLRFKDEGCKKTWNLSSSVSIGCVLPVEWVYVNAEPAGDLVTVSWAAVNEMNNDRFVIERSADGFTYEAIGVVKGSSGSHAIAEYKFEDRQPLYGKSYYRIRQVDFDGQSNLSSVAPVSFEELLVQLSPNPSQNEFHMEIPGKEKVSLTVTDMLGKEIFSANGISEISFGSEFPSGAYMVKVISEEKVLVKKVIKE
ncbi:MAG: T9SS type A sorting domain-containing protein [Cytophagaceae bacterium]